MKDDILQRIDLVREDEELLLPRKRFGGENAKYIKLGVFKKSPEILDSVPCPNGCGEMVKVIAKTQRGYLVVCDHGDKPSEDIYLPPDEVELYKLDWVTLKRLIGEGAIDYVRPSTPEERKRNPKAAKIWMCEVAERIIKALEISKADCARYINEKASLGDAFWNECKEIRELRHIHGWQENSVYVFIREHSANHAPSKTIANRAKRRSNAKKRKKDWDGV